MKSSIRTTALALLLPAVSLGSARTAYAQQVVNSPKEDKRLTGSAATLFSIGKEEGESWQVYSFIPAVTFNATGNLFILDRDNARVVEFGPDGKYVRQFGKKGEGPGEFTAPVAVAALSDGRLAVRDAARGTISIFDANGTYKSLVPQESGVRLGGNLTAYPPGGLLVTTGGTVIATGGGLPTFPDSTPVVVVPTDAGNAPATGSQEVPAGALKTRVLFQAPAFKPTISQSGSGGRQQLTMTGPPVFSPSFTWAPLPDGRVVANWSGDYDLRVARAEGGIGWIYHRPISARKTTDADRELAKSQRREAMENGTTNNMRVQVVNGRQTTSFGGKIPPQQIEQALAGMTFAETVPVVRRLRTDPMGRIWVERDAGSGNKDYPIDLLNANGQYLGTVRGMTMPDAFAADGRAAFIETDEMGVQHVVVRRLPDWPK